jgi:hypothetical protein
MNGHQGRGQNVPATVTLPSPAPTLICAFSAPLSFSVK